MTEYRKAEEAVKAVSSGVALVAVSKFHPYEAVMEAYAEGARIFGENRVQEMREKFPPKDARPDGMKVFLIGQLQRNKVKKAIEWADRIESVDSILLLQKIEAECEALDATMEILFEFNSSGEEQKSGFRTGGELLDAARLAISSCPRVSVAGVMTVGPLGYDESANERAFRATAAIFSELRAIIPSASVLSMGMSADWRTAIACGSNEVRIGTAIFGERDYGR